MRNIKYIFAFVFTFIISISTLKANTLNSLDIEATIDKDGIVHVVEVWDMNNSEGTEVYKQELNLGEMNITNFSVSDESYYYTGESNWNVDGSFEDKAYKYGINTVSNGIELCWGISEYGHKTYTISYDLENAIFLVDDAQVFERKFVNALNTPAKNFTVVITGYEDFSDSLDVWGYGYKGYAYVNGGKIYLSNDENTSLSSTDYAVLLVKFPLNYFELANEIRHDDMITFDDVEKDVENGSYDYDYGEGSNIIGTITNIIIFLLFDGVFAAIIIGKEKYKFGEAGKKINMNDINAFRDIPCKKDIYRAYFIAQAYKLNKKNTDFFGSIFLKWIDKDKISIVKEEKKKLLGGTKEVISVDLSKFGESDIKVEQDIYNIIYAASNDGILEEDEFEKYAKNHYNKLLDWFTSAEEYGRDLYCSDSLVTKAGSKYLIDDKVKNDAIELAGLKKYLMEFASMDEKKPIEVKLWKEYLMYAQIFGIADQVAKQFKKLYPEVIQEMQNSNIDVADIILLNHFSSAAVVSASSARTAARNYSAGGGGFSSGGGGGSFGGGGGGGTR